MTTSNLLNSNNFYTDSKIDSSTFSEEVITFSNLIDFRIDFLGEPDKFSTPYNEIFWYPKAKFAIEVTHRGILDTISFEFKFEIPIFFHNNYPAMLQFYHSYYGLLCQRLVLLQSLPLHLIRCRISAVQI
jgi:hypothetical protein